jgi:hypothetical protein
MAEIVDKLFENSKQALPVYVSALPSLRMGITVGIAIFVLGSLTALVDRYMQKDSEDVIERTRWLFIVALSVYVAAIATDYVRDKHYTIRSVTLNQQHYANVAWLADYVKAIKA